MDKACFPRFIAFSKRELLLNINHPQSIIRVAEVSNRIVGFILARMEIPSQAHLITLDVSPEFRKQKAGTILVKTLHAELVRHAINSVILEVSVNNFPAQRLYEKLQYRYVGIIPGYYKGREDAYLMQRSMDDDYYQLISE